MGGKDVVEEEVVAESFMKLQTWSPCRIGALMRKERLVSNLDRVFARAVVSSSWSLLGLVSRPAHAVPCLFRVILPDIF